MHIRGFLSSFEFAKNWLLMPATARSSTPQAPAAPESNTPLQQWILAPLLTMAPAFDISTTKGVGSLNGYLSGRSYLDGKGFSPSRTLILPSTSS